MSSWESNAVGNGWGYSNGWSYDNNDDDSKWHTNNDDDDSKWHTNNDDDDSKWHTNNDNDSKWHIKNSSNDNKCYTNYDSNDSKWHTNNSDDIKWYTNNNVDEGERYTTKKADDSEWQTKNNAFDYWEADRAVTNDLITHNTTAANENDQSIETKTVQESSSNLGETQRNTSFHIDGSNISKHANGDYKAPGYNSCRNCGSEGHFARECPEAKKYNGECYNCGQIGHSKADCPEPRRKTGECYNCGELGHNKVDCTKQQVNRPFTGECNICHTQGHRAAECPEKPPMQCRNCLKEGHFASECTENRVFDKTNIADVDNDEAWKMIQMASDEYDMDDFKSAVAVYTKNNKTLTYLDLEKAFREAQLNFYLIAQEKIVPNTMTIVDLQGQADRKYVVGYFRSPEPRTPRYSNIFPSNANENLERLKDAGDVMDSMIPVCRNCGERGHMSRACPREKIERIYPEKYNRCINCLAVGHILRDCPEERVDRSIRCRNCDKPGHIAKDCPEPRSAAGLECHRCKEVGHYAKDCPNNVEGEISGRTCRNCGEDGHIARECENPKNDANLRCLNCDQMGHFSRDCPEPKDWSRVKCSYCQQLGHTVKRCPDLGNAALNIEQENRNHSAFEQPFEPNKSIDSAWENPSINKTSNEWESYGSSNDAVNDLAESINDTSLSASNPGAAYGQRLMASKASEWDTPTSKDSYVVDISKKTATSEVW